MQENSIVNLHTGDRIVKCLVDNVSYVLIEGQKDESQDDGDVRIFELNTQLDPPIDKPGIYTESGIECQITQGEEVTITEDGVIIVSILNPVNGNDGDNYALIVDETE